MLRLISKRWVQIIILLALLAGFVELGLHPPPLVQRWRQLTFDAYNKLMPRPAGTGVLIIDIDEDSLRKYGQWPWPRPLVAQIPGILHEMGAKSITFDIVFAEPDRTSPSLIADRLPQTMEMHPVVEALKGLPDNDKIFADKILGMGNVVTGFCAADKDTGREPLLRAKFMNDGIKANPLEFIDKRQYYATSLPVIVENSAGHGSFTMTPTNDGIVRQVPLLIGQQIPGKEAKMYPALSLEALRVALGKTIYRVTSFGERTEKGYGIKSISLGEYSIPTDLHGNFQVYYAGHNKHWLKDNLYIPAWKVIERQITPDLIKDKIIFVGTSAIGLLDLRSSPIDSSLPGVEVHAEVIEQILGGQYLERPDIFNGIELCATVAISLFVIFLAPFIGTGTLALVVVMLIGSGIVGALVAYQPETVLSSLPLIGKMFHLGKSGYLFDPVYPTLATTTIFILSAVLTNLRSELERRAVRTAFSHYISPTLMEELTGDPDKLKLGGEVRELSVMFTDIRNFTTISEGMDPAELIKMMNDFLTPMTSCVLNNRGTIDKYMGDAMMAFWNAPLDDPDHARHACLSALQMLASLSAVNDNLRARAAEGKISFRELKAGIGIHTGKASVGNMGSKQRFAYSALGDTVNLASRLEGQTKNYGISIMISEEVRQQAPEFAAVEIDLLTVKGRREPERIYVLLGDAALAKDAGFQAFTALHGRMLEAYRKQQWDEAETLAKQCLDAKPNLIGLYTLYLQRIRDFRATPPDANWQGVWVAKDK